MKRLRNPDLNAGLPIEPAGNQLERFYSTYGRVMANGGVEDYERRETLSGQQQRAKLVATEEPPRLVLTETYVRRQKIIGWALGGAVTHENVTVIRLENDGMYASSQGSGMAVPANAFRLEQPIDIVTSTPPGFNLLPSEPAPQV